MDTTWIMEILIETGGAMLSRREWRAARTSGGIIYQYATKQEARTMLDICYPDVLSECKRVREVSQEKFNRLPEQNNINDNGNYDL